MAADNESMQDELAGWRDELVQLKSKARDLPSDQRLELLKAVRDLERDLTVLQTIVGKTAIDPSDTPDAEKQNLADECEKLRTRMREAKSIANEG